MKFRLYFMQGFAVIQTKILVFFKLTVIIILMDSIKPTNRGNFFRILIIITILIIER